jgi:HSP20 family protein
MPGSDDPLQGLEQLLDQFTEPLTSTIPVDVVDTGEELVVFADVPGRDSDAVQVSLEDDRLLHIEVPEQEQTVDGQYVTRGREHGSATRTVALPAAVDEDRTEATYDRGVLTVRLGKPTGGDEIDIQVE